MDERQLPIDKGWAWVIVGAASSLFGLQAGGFKCQGILLVELAEVYEGIYPTSTLIWVLTSKYLLCTLIAPLVGFLTVKFTYRAVSIFGLLLHAAGYIGLAYAPNFPAMILLHSIPSGVGDGTIFLCAMLVSGQYFKRRKALALGIIASGSGIATMVLPFVYRLLFANFDFSGACLLYAGFCLQFLMAACLFRPLSYYADHRQHSMSTLMLADKQTETEQKDLLESSEEIRNRSVSLHCTRTEVPTYTTTFHSVSHIPSAVHTTEHITSLADVHGSMFVMEKSETTKSKSPAEDFNAKFNLQVLLKPEFYIVGLSIALYAFGVCVVYQGIPSLAKESSVEKSSVAIALMIGGGVEIPCRILNGVLADRKLVTNTTQYAMALFFPGLMCLFCAFIGGLTGIALVLIGMSTVGTSVFSIIPVVIIELLGTEYVTSGMSIQVLCQSLAYIGSSYITGVIYNTSGSWRLVYFYISAMMILASCAVWPYCLLRWCQSNCTGSRNVSGDETPEVQQ